MDFSNVTLNEAQAQLMNEVRNWYYNSSEQVFQYSGAPGTGKTFMYNYIAHDLGIDQEDIAPMTYIGAPALQLRRNGMWNAKTIHSWLLRPVKDYKRNELNQLTMNDYFQIPEMGIKFVKKKLPENIKLIIVDEGGSVPYYLKQVILDQGIKVLVGGDLNQLMPVKDKPAFLYDGKVFRLTQIMRQAEGSAIVYLSNLINNNKKINNGFYGDVLVIDRSELTDTMINQSDVIICGKNTTRQYFTNRIRNDILKVGGISPQYGERVICRKNNWMLERDGISLANGLEGNIISTPSPLDKFGDTLSIDFLPRMMDNVGVFRNLMIDYKYLIADFKDKQALKYTQRDKYRRMEKFEYAYAITTHIAQGSQYNGGIYYEEYLNPQTNTRLNYTGLTRFKKWCIYVKSDRKLY